MIDLLQVAARTPNFMIALAGTLAIAIGAYFYGRYQEERNRIEHNVSFYFLDKENKVKGPVNILHLVDGSADIQIWNESQQKWMKLSELPSYNELRKMRSDQTLAYLLLLFGIMGWIIIELFI